MKEEALTETTDALEKDVDRWNGIYYHYQPASQIQKYIFLEVVESKSTTTSYILDNIGLLAFKNSATVILLARYKTETHLRSAIFDRPKWFQMRLS